MPQVDPDDGRATVAPESMDAAPSPVSLCATLFNEIESVETWLDSIAAQIRQPDEIVLCDGGSSDGTIDVLRRRSSSDPRIRILIERGANVAAGRNHAIERASGSIIAVTDAGTILDPNWLARLVAPLESDPELAVSAGFYRPAGRNSFERVLATVITPRKRDLPPDGFPPSSRSVAFRKKWWRLASGYPDWLRACEDLVFDFRLREQGARFAFADDAIVSWYPRPNLREFFAQYRHYARGDGHGHLFASRHIARYSAYSAGCILIALSLRSRITLPLLLLGMYFYLRKFFRRVREENPLPGPVGTIASMALVPVIVVTGDVAKMVGYPQGLLERQRAGGPNGLASTTITSHREVS